MTREWKKDDAVWWFAGQLKLEAVVTGVTAGRLIGIATTGGFERWAYPHQLERRYASPLHRAVGEALDA